MQEYTNILVWFKQLPVQEKCTQTYLILAHDKSNIWSNELYRSTFFFKELFV